MNQKVKDFFSKTLILIGLSVLMSVNLYATHNRAGEITYVQLSDLTYEITITTFTYTLSFADRPTLNVEWGDNSTSVAPRISMLSLPNLYRRNVYKITHTFPGPGIYKIVVQDPNRNLGVKNIPNSVNVVFSISTILTVNPAMGRDNTPVLLNPPYDKAAYHYIFIHNPAAFDPDGDSLSYALTVCTREDGKPIVGYTLPPATDSIYVNPVTGDLVWNTPADSGKFNVAMDIIEWRNGKKIGVVERDMQIEVYNTKNKPPINSPLKNYCLQVGDTVDFVFSATDPNNDSISLKATSGIFSITSCPATFTPIDSAAGHSSSRFRWIPCHDAVRSQPYNVIFKSDDHNTDVRLSDIDNMNIKVLGPSPHIINAVPVGKQINLSWANYGTTVIAGFSIYRREGATTFKPDSCTAGLPASLGFAKVGYIDGSQTTGFSDSNSGQGLEYGKEYTYRIVAVYPNGTESKASNEITSTLVSGVPVIKRVTVQSTSSSAGTIYVEWKKPDRLDTIPANGPYEYLIYRATGVSGSDYQQIKSIQTTDLTDTTFTDVSLITQGTGYIYKIELYNNAPGNRFLIGEPAYASSLYLAIAPGDRKAKFTLSRNVPWINTRYDFFRLNNNTMEYDSVGTTNQLEYADQGLENGKEYCYYVRSVGGYLANDMPKNLINLSETICITPVDNEPPCPPSIIVSTQCDSLYNKISWSVTADECNRDIAGFKLYYKLTTDENLSLLTDIADPAVHSYKHFPGDVIAGCYAITAYDSVGNESEKSVMVCIDSCNFYEIPNVFTPNGDDINEKLVARTSGLVEKIDFRLFNRNGLLLFKTENPRIEWDGTYKGRIVSPGVYFYQCDVYERRISGLELFHLTGFVHVITEKGAKLKNTTTK
jgi:gliding motility-associated-like protein